VGAELRALGGRLRRRRTGAIPVADGAFLGSAARRTRGVRIVLAGAVIAAIVCAFLAAPSHPGRRYLPAKAVGIVVLDVSSSVRPTTYFRIEQTLDTIAASRARLGLGLFSDVAYEAFPTGTPAAALQPILRFFAPPAQTGSAAGQTYLAESPWQQWFSAGTSISSGLYLAEHMLEAEHARSGAVLLISDLSDDPEDAQALKNSVVLLEQKSIPLEIVALAPTIGNANYFKSLLGTQAIYQTAQLPTGSQAAGKIEVSNGFSVALAVFALLAVGLLALDTWWAEPFRFGERPA
jgi:hypothetical protein